MFKTKIILHTDGLSETIIKYNIDNQIEININKTKLSIQSLESNASNENKPIKKKKKKKNNKKNMDVESIETELTNTKSIIRKDQKIKCPFTNCTKTVKHPGILLYI